MRRGVHANRKIQRHFNKCGEDDLIISALEDVANKKDLVEREQFYLDTIKPYFNIAPIAGSCLGVRHSDESKERRRHLKNKLGKKLSPEQKETVRQGQLKRFQNPLQREAASARMKGKVSINKGKKFTAERAALSSGENHGMHKLTDAQVLEIRKLYQPPRFQQERREYSSRKLAKMFGVSGAQIRRILTYTDRKIVNI